MSKKIEEIEETEEIDPKEPKTPKEKPIDLMEGHRKPKEPKEKPFNGLDFSPVIESINQGFKELKETLKPEPTSPPPPEPKKDDYRILDELGGW